METQPATSSKQSLTPPDITHRSYPEQSRRSEGGSVTLPATDLRTLVLLLIKEDLRSNKLVLGLSALGLDAGRYHTELSTVIFSLLGLDAGDDHLQGMYFECIDKASEIEDVEDGKMMMSMAEGIYERLVGEKYRDFS
jgi:hypothetical protein